MALCKVYTTYGTRSVGAGGAGVAAVTPDFGRSVNPISTSGADYSHHITTPPPDFQTLLRPCGTYHFYGFPLGCCWSG